MESRIVMRYDSLLTSNKSHIWWRRRNSSFVA